MSSKSKGKALMKLAEQAGLKSEEALREQLRKSERLRRWAYGAATGSAGVGAGAVVDAVSDDPVLLKLISDTFSSISGSSMPAAETTEPVTDLADLADLANVASQHMSNEVMLREAFANVRIAVASFGGIDRFRAVRAALAYPDEVVTAYGTNQ